MSSFRPSPPSSITNFLQPPTPLPSLPQNKKLLEGLTDGQIDAAALGAKNRHQPGYLLPLQNTVQQTLFASLANRETRASVYNNSWNRAERGGDADTRETLLKIANLRAEKAQLLGYPNFAAWISRANGENSRCSLEVFGHPQYSGVCASRAEAKDIQAVIDKQPHPFPLAAYDWDFYSDQVRKAKYDLIKTDSAVLRTESCSPGRRFLRRDQALRHHLQRAQEHSGLPFGRSCIRS